MTANRTSYHTVTRLAEEYGAESEIDAHIIPDDQSDFGLCAIGAHSTDRIIAMLKQVVTEDRKYPHWSTLPGAPSTARTCGAGTVMGYISPMGLFIHVSIGVTQSVNCGSQALPNYGGRAKPSPNNGKLRERELSERL